jgi:hypothetical protein
VLICGTKLPRPSTTRLLSGGGGAVNNRGAPTMAGVGTAATFAGGEVVGGACSNVGSDTTESKSITPSGGAIHYRWWGQYWVRWWGSSGFGGGGGGTGGAAAGDVSPMRRRLEFN